MRGLQEVKVLEGEGGKRRIRRTPIAFLCRQGPSRPSLEGSGDSLVDLKAEELVENILQRN